MSMKMNQLMLAICLSSGLALSFSTAQAATTETSPVHAKTQAVVQPQSHQALSKNSAHSDSMSAAKPHESAKSSNSKVQHHPLAKDQAALASGTAHHAAKASTEPQAAAHKAVNKISINTATAAQLQKLNGIGAAKAQAIVAYRKQHGGFKRLEDLKNVKGLSASIIAKNQALLSI